MRAGSTTVARIVRGVPGAARAVAVLCGAAIASASLACAPRGAGSATGAEPPAPVSVPTRSSLELRIESHNSSDVVIYAARGRMRQRIGTVTGSTTRTLAIPIRFATDPGGFFLIAHRLGGTSGTDFNSPTVLVQPGQTVVWTLESDLERSAIAVL